MSKIICSAAIRGAHTIVNRAEQEWQQAMDTWGGNQEVGFPNTAYYLPIIYAAFRLGLAGGLLAALMSTLSYLPHAFLHFGHLPHDPASTTEKSLEILLFFLMGAVAGYLAEQERKRRAELQASLDEQQRLQRQLVRAGRLSALGEVVAGIAHEIKNPLHALRGTAEIVDPLIACDTEEHRMWEIHQSEIERLERVADRFLSFATPQPAELGDLDLREVAQRLLELIEADARKKGVQVEVRAPADPVIVIGDRDQLAQVALNIALNAMRAIGEQEGTILVSVNRYRDKMPTLRIENSGPAIAEDELEHLFDPFHGTDEQGSGLGLSISARIVEQHSGYIEVANEGLGVAFTVHLPAN